MISYQVYFGYFMPEMIVWYQYCQFQNIILANSPEAIPTNSYRLWHWNVKRHSHLGARGPADTPRGPPGHEPTRVHPLAPQSLENATFDHPFLLVLVGGLLVIIFPVLLIFPWLLCLLCCLYLFLATLKLLYSQSTLFPLGISCLSQIPVAIDLPTHFFICPIFSFT